jgi:transglutaminase-like putative cysteine protease
VTDAEQRPLAKRPLVWALVAAEAAAATFVAATPWLRAYRLGALAPLLAVAAGASVLVAVAVAVWWRRSPLVSYGCSLAALVVLLVVGVSHDASALVQGAARGPSHLLTDTLPLISPRSLVVPAVLVCWVAGAATGELLCRSARTGAVLAVPVAAYVAAYAVSSGAPGTGAGAGAVLLAVLAALGVTRRELEQADRPRAVVEPAASATADPRSGDGMTGGPGPGGRLPRGALGGAAFASLVAVAAWLVVPGLPGLGKAGTSLSRRPATATALTISPVEAIAALRDDDPTAPATTMFSVRTAEASSGYVAVATLDHYDGDTWSFDRTFEPTGGRVPPPPAGIPSTLGPTVRQRYVVRQPLGPSLPFVPYIDRPVEVQGLTLDEDPSSGMVAPVGPVRAGAAYSVTSRVATDTLSQLPPASGVAPVESGIDSQLPANADADLTGTLQYLGRLTGLRPSPTVQFLQAALAAISRTDRRIDPAAAPSGRDASGRESRGGTSLAEVIDATTVARQATPEQFAILFVAVARALGVQARLVTGFRIHAPGAAGVNSEATGAVPPGSYQVTNRQGWTWTEVAVAGEGWVVADPTPAQTTTARSIPPVAGAQTTATVAPPQANALPSNGRGGHALAPSTPVRIPHQGHLSPLWAVGGVLVGLLALCGAVLALVVVRRSLRRFGRRRGAAGAAAVGAWLELLDGLARYGIEPGPAATTGEVAELAGRSYGPEMAEPVRAVGNLADRAVCSTHSGVDGAAAETAWRTSMRVNRQLRTRLSRPQRLRAALVVGRHPARPTSRRPRNRSRRRAASGRRG